MEVSYVRLRCQSLNDEIYDDKIIQGDTSNNIWLSEFTIYTTTPFENIEKLTRFINWVNVTQYSADN